MTAHARRKIRVKGQGDDTGRMRPVLEQAAVVVGRRVAIVEKQLIEQRGVVAAQPASERDVLCSVDDLQRVDLYPAHTLYRRVDILNCRSAATTQRLVQSLGMQCERKNCIQRVGRPRTHGRGVDLACGRAATLAGRPFVDGSASRA